MVEAILIIIFVAFITWLVSFFIIRAISRYREYSADRGSAQMTGKPAKLANALMKISGAMNQTPDKDLRQVEGLNAFFIIPAISTRLLLIYFQLIHQLKKEYKGF